jgi:hypothetical protein
MATTDYTGRFVDLFIFEGAEPADEQRIRLGFTEEGGQVTAGIQKLVQSFALLFLTEQGSIAAQPTQGTEFVGGMRVQRIQDEADVLSEFTLAKELVRQQLALAANDSDLPDDEILDDATLESFNLNGDTSTLSLNVRVTSLAGDEREVVLPVPVAIR